MISETVAESSLQIVEMIQWLINERSFGELF